MNYEKMWFALKEKAINDNKQKTIKEMNELEIKEAKAKSESQKEKKIGFYS